MPKKKEHELQLVCQGADFLDFCPFSGAKYSHNPREIIVKYYLLAMFV